MVLSTVGSQGTVGAQATAKWYTFTAAGGVYYVDGVQQDTLYLIRGQKYIFDGSAASSHPLRLSTDSGNSSAYTSGYTVGAGNTHTFVVPYDAPDTLYYYCTSHANMGGAIGIRDLTANDLQGTQGLQGNQGLQEQFTRSIHQGVQGQDLKVYLGEQEPRCSRSDRDFPIRVFKVCIQLHCHLVILVFKVDQGSWYSRCSRSPRSLYSG